MAVLSLSVIACGTPDDATAEIVQESWGADPPGLVEVDRIVGIGIASSSPDVYAWTAANTVSAGITTNFAWKRSPYRFSATPTHDGRSIVAMAIASNDHVFTWYSDGTRSEGTSSNLDRYDSPRSFVAAGGRDPAEIVGIAIAKSNNYVYAWYTDGKVSVGHTTNLGSRTGPGKPWSSERTYHLPGYRPTSDIVGMAIAPMTNHVFTWYRDGFVSEGTTRSLAAYKMPFPYTRHGVLNSVFPANPPPLDGVQPGPQPPTTIAPLATTVIPTGPNTRDHTLAAGHRFFAVSFDSSVRFYNRDGTDLTGGSLVGNSADLSGMIEPFQRTSPISTDPRLLDVNHYLDFGDGCDAPGIPVTRRYKFCVSSGVYDTRVSYDAVGRRFVIVGHIRNPLWTNLWQPEPKPKIGCEDYDSYYATGSNPCDTEDAGALGHMARRLKVIAVSRAEDPRFGFHVYVFVQNNYRDAPWFAINGDWAIISTKIGADTRGPAATLMPLADLREGRKRPQFIHYREGDLRGALVVEPPRQYGSLPNHSLVTGTDGDGDWRVYALPHPALPYQKAAAGSALIAPNDEFPIVGMDQERFAFRANHLHIVGHRARETIDDRTYYDVSYGRVGLSVVGNTPVLDYGSTALRTAVFTNTTPGLNRSYEDPAMEINAADDVMFVFGETGTAESPAGWIQPDRIVRIVWRGGVAAPGPMVTWRGNSTSLSSGSHGTYIKALSPSIDPSDPNRFWGIHVFAASENDWDAFVGTHRP